jgi:hypothetical protein
MGHKVVINTCFGGFGLSEAAEARYNEIAVERGMDEIESVYDLSRHCPILVQVVEELGSDANGYCAELYIVQIPGDRYKVREYDGAESIETPDSIRWTVIE